MHRAKSASLRAWPLSKRWRAPAPLSTVILVLVLAGCGDARTVGANATTTVAHTPAMVTSSQLQQCVEQAGYNVSMAQLPANDLHALAAFEDIQSGTGGVALGHLPFEMIGSTGGQGDATVMTYGDASEASQAATQANVEAQYDDANGGWRANVAWVAWTNTANTAAAIAGCIP